MASAGLGVLICARLDAHLFGLRGGATINGIEGRTDMKRLIVAIVAVVATIHSAKAADTIVQVAGQSFTNATITSDGVFVKVVSSSGIERFPISRMTTNEQARWNYNPDAAAIQAKQAAAAEAAVKASFAKQQATINAANAEQGVRIAASEAKAKAEAEKAANKQPVQQSPESANGFGNLQNFYNATQY